MKTIEMIFERAADFLWGDWLLFALLGLGIFYTIVTGGIQFRCIPLIARGVFKGGRKTTENDEGKNCSSYQALCAAIASCVGSGNIVGVSTAILSGGPGALFWMWFAAVFGMATKFGEITMGVRYHGKDAQGNIAGGPMYYIAKGLNWKGIGALVAILLFIQNCGATLIQSNTIAQVSGEAFRAPVLLTAVIVAVIMSLIISGGFKRLVQVAQNVSPIMAGIYIVAGLIVLAANAGQIPDMFAAVFEGAFSLKAGTGALAGITIKEAMRFGVARGLYSNEAGEGTAAVLHSSAQVDHPARQGFYGIVEVFVDTILICSTTGFTVLVTGVNQVYDNAATLTAAAFESVFPGMQYVTYISLLLFAGTSIMSQWYFGHISLTFLNKPKWASVYRVIFPFLIILGSLSTINLVWSVQDVALGLLIIPNIVALIFLAPEVRKMTKEFLDPKNGYIAPGRRSGKKK